MHFQINFCPFLYIKELAFFCMLIEKMIFYAWGSGSEEAFFFASGYKQIYK